VKNPAQAITCLIQAVEMTQQLPDLSRETASMLNYLADLYLQEGQLAQAEAAIRRAVQINLALPGAERTLGADDLMILAKVLSRQARHREAHKAATQALALFRQQQEADDEFITQMEEMVEEFGRKRELGPSVQVTPNRAEQDVSAARREL
jgi:tetratricopeptide (TPR) repeat protein